MKYWFFWCLIAIVSLCAYREKYIFGCFMLLLAHIELCAVQIVRAIESVRG